MVVEYLENIINEEEQKQIIEEFENIDIVFYRKKPAIMNAAIDELVGHVVIWLNSKEVQAVINFSELASFIFKAIKAVKKLVKNKKLNRFTYTSQQIQPVKVIIQVDNIIILQQDTSDAISFDDYLTIALVASISPSVPKDREIIISCDDGIHIETIEQYAHRKMKI